MTDILVRPVTKLMHELGRSRRGFYRLMVAVLAAVAIFLVVSSGNYYTLMLSLVILLFVFGFAIYDYLEPERLRNRDALRERVVPARVEEHHLTRVMEEVSQRVIATIPKPESPSTDERNEYVEKVASALSVNLKEVLASLQSDANRRQFAEQSALIRTRLEEEIDALGRRGRVNLTIGALFAFSGIAALGYYALWYEYTSITELGIKFFPKVTFVILVEVFSYFFLNLYRHSIFEIKYFQNEMTNMDSRIIAIKGCLLTGDLKTASKICEHMSRTERNFILKKGETSLQEKEIEAQAKGEKTFVSNLKEVADVLGLKSARQQP